MTFQVHRIAPLVEIPSRRSWGEAWWTARDICITNEPELPDPIQALVDEMWRREYEAFILGPTCRDTSQ